MAGRLQQFDDFIEQSKNVQQKQKLPKKQNKQKQVKKQFQADNYNSIKDISREKQNICLLFYKNGKNEKKYLRIIFPHINLTHKDARYVQIIDVDKLCRKIILRSRIIKLIMTKKKLNINQKAIRFK